MAGPGRDLESRRGIAEVEEAVGNLEGKKKKWRLGMRSGKPVEGCGRLGGELGQLR